MATQTLSATRPTPTHAAPVARRATPRSLLVITAIGAVALTVPLAASGAFYGSFALSENIASGVTVAGLSVGDLTVEQAAVALDDLWNRQLTLQVVDPPSGAAWTMTPGEMGLSVDALRTAQRAYTVGREQQLLHAIRQVATSLTEGVDHDPVVAVDLPAAQRRLELLAEVAATPAEDARLEIVAGVVHVFPAREGRDLNIGATLELIAADPTALLVEYGFVPLIFTPQPASIAEVQAAATEAERLLAAPTTLLVYDPVTDEMLGWTPERSTVGEWITVSKGGTQDAIALDSERIARSVDAWSDSLGDERQVDVRAAAAALQELVLGRAAPPVVLHYEPTAYGARGGESLAAIGFRHGLPTWKIQEYNPAMSPYAGLAAGTEIVLPPKDAMLLLPVVPGKRIVISITEQRLWTYDAGALRSEHVISTGIARSPTLPGLFQVQSHYENAYASRWDLWMPHFLGIYDALPGFTNGIHGLPLLSSGVRLWGNVLGRPASYGCIILDLKAAEELYAWAEDGVVVEIRR
jgi:lipoprotein-anchoring transpeptidase ErfK/SrfK